MDDFVFWHEFEIVPLFVATSSMQHRFKYLSILKIIIIVLSKISWLNGNLYTQKNGLTFLFMFFFSWKKCTQIIMLVNNHNCVWTKKWLSEATEWWRKWVLKLLVFKVETFLNFWVLKSQHFSYLQMGKQCPSMYKDVYYKANSWRPHWDLYS